MTALRDLAAGRGGVPAIRALARARLNRHLLLLRAIVQDWPGPATTRDAAVELLDEAQRRAPGRVAEILSYPMVGAWAAGTARRLRDGDPTDVGHLAGIAAAAALAAGVDADVTGIDTLPTIGRVRDGRIEAVHRLTATAHGMTISVLLDDVDAYRHGHHAPAADRLPAGEVRRWRVLFAAAWELLAGELPGRAAEIAAGLRSLVPLAQPEPGAARSATLRDAFGVFGLTPPASPADFAVTIVHEFQHSKLSVVLDLVPLYDPADRALYYAPWRADPRPLGGLLQGVYAFVGVADTWRALAARPALHDAAIRQFAEAREQVDAGLGELRRCGALTPAGEAFVAGLRTAADALLAEPLPDPVVEEARAALDRNRAGWRRRNGIPAGV